MPVEVGLDWAARAARWLDSFHSTMPVFARRLSQGKSLILSLHLIAFMMQATICAILAPIELMACSAAGAARTMVGSGTVWTRATRQVLGRRMALTGLCSAPERARNAVAREIGGEDLRHPLGLIGANPQQHLPIHARKIPDYGKNFCVRRLVRRRKLRKSMPA
jgi:hypothetical protein